MQKITSSKTIDCSVVVSIYNESESISSFYKALSSVLSSLGISYEIIFVNDGSADDSLVLLKEITKGDNMVKIIAFFCQNIKNLYQQCGMIFF